MQKTDAPQDRREAEVVEAVSEPTERLPWRAPAARRIDMSLAEFGGAGNSDSETLS